MNPALMAKPGKKQQEKPNVRMVRKIELQGIKTHAAGIGFTEKKRDHQQKTRPMCIWIRNSRLFSRSPLLWLPNRSGMKDDTAISPRR